MQFYFLSELGEVRTYYPSCSNEVHREVAEWLKAHAWKACIQQCIGGSNPFFSAIRSPNLFILNLLGFFNSLFSPYLDQNI